MIDVKQRLDLGGDRNWPQIPTVTVPGQPESRAWQKDGGDEIIRSWQRVAVLQISPTVPVVVGFISGTTVRYLRYIISYPQFGMRIGPEAVSFFVAPTLLVGTRSMPLLTLVEVAQFDDPRYSHLPVF